MFLLETISFFLSTVSILALSYFKISNDIFQQIAAFSLALTLIFLIRLIFPHIELLKGRALRLLLLFLTSTLVQFLVISSGGLYSPFLILIHLYTLGISFVLNSRSHISFLLFSIVALGVNMMINPQVMSLIQHDPGPLVLYIVSFITIIPLAQFLMSSYHFKDALFLTLKEYARIGEKREGAILTSLREMVIVTDKDFNIISTNDAVGKILKLPPEDIIHHNISSVLSLKDVAENLIDLKNLTSEQLVENVARIVNNLYLQSKTDNLKRKVSVQVRPITNSEGSIYQIIFIIGDASQTEIDRHSDLAPAQQRYQKLAQDLRQTLLTAHLQKPLSSFELLEKIEEDLQLATEIEDHPIQQTIELYDIAYLAKQVSKNKQQLAASLGVSLQFELSPEYVSEKAMLDLIDSNLPLKQLPFSNFSVNSNKKWVDIILQKLIDMAILLSSKKNNSVVKVTSNLLSDNVIDVQVIFPYPSSFSPEEKEALFREYYGDLGIKTPLRIGSGLEGFIAKTIANQLNLAIDVNYSKDISSVIFSLKFAKLPLT